MPIYNCHTHIFTLKHVPDKFGKKLLPWYLAWLKINHLEGIFKNKDLLNKILKISRLFYRTGGAVDEMIKRYLVMAKYANCKNQKDIFKLLRSYYPKDAQMVVLTMDMKYMEAGLPKEDYKKQLDQIVELKREYKELIKPFIFVDPRRIEDEKGFEKEVEMHLTLGVFEGIKIYPALGYYPFDFRLMNLYKLALKYDIPIMTHCIDGVVHFRGSKKQEWFTHPVTGVNLPEINLKKYTTQFTHPLNYLFLVRKEYLSKYLKTTPYKGIVPDLSNLKICFGHWGGGEEWNRYLADPWVSYYEDAYSELDINEEKFNHVWNTYSWFSICNDLINDKNYNFYADLSFTFHDEKHLPLLKVTLLNNQRLRKRILFGTDFYVVAQKETEREFGIDIRGYLGEELFNDIARINPEIYLTKRPFHKKALFEKEKETSSIK